MWHSVLSLPHKRRSISAMFSSNKFHNITYTLYIQTHHCSCTLQLLHTRQTISAILNSNYIAATHNTTHSPCTSTCTTYPALPSPLAFHNPPICTQLTQGRFGKMTQAVEVVVLWCHSHLVWLVLRVPSLNVLVFFFLKTFDSLWSKSAIHSLQSQLQGVYC